MNKNMSCLIILFVLEQLSYSDCLLMTNKQYFVLFMTKTNDEIIHHVEKCTRVLSSTIVFHYIYI